MDAEARIRRNQAVETESTVGARTVNSIPDQLWMLAGLRDHGMITDHEFEAEKAGLFSRMFERSSASSPLGPHASGATVDGP
jgi:hypothetical protein